MARLTNTAPARLHHSDVTTISDDPLIGLLNLETDDGTIELAINQVVAEELIERLKVFLSERS